LERTARTLRHGTAHHAAMLPIWPPNHSTVYIESNFQPAQYYSAWEEKSPSEQLALAAVIANNISGGDKPIWEANITFLTSVDLLLTLKALTDFS